MLKFYYSPLSPFARPVWLMLLEKGLDFEPIQMQLNGDQFTPEYLALNPFGHIPVIVDDGFRVFECLAILDYLEAKYPKPRLLPQDPEALATVRMVNLSCANEFIPAIGGLILNEPGTEDRKFSHLRALQVLDFFAATLGDRPYLAGTEFSVAEVMAGCLLASYVDMGNSLDRYPNLQRWLTGLRARETWQKIQLSSEDYETFKRGVRIMLKARSKRRKQRFAAFLNSEGGAQDV